MAEAVTPLVRIVEAGVAADTAARMVVSGIDQLDLLERTWASAGAVVERRDGRLHAVSTAAALASAAARCLPAQDAAALDEAVRGAVRTWTSPARPLHLPDGQLGGTGAPIVMGIVNVTPDSFSDGGLVYPAGHPRTAIAHGEALLAGGADILDIGGESTRPGAEAVDVEEELGRVVPVVKALAANGARCSIDTSKPEVAAASIAAGAVIVNDVSGARDPRLLQVVAGSGAGYVLMHTRGTPADMRSLTAYADVVAEVYEFLADGVARCAEAGITMEGIVVDPGIGFAKTAAQSLGLLRATRQFRGLGRPVLIGASRKSFIGTLLPGAAMQDRLEGSLAAAVYAVAAGAEIVRVHDVAETVRAVTVARAIADA